MKQYYQFMLRGVVTDAQGLQTNANIDEFEEDLHKMLVVGFLTFLLSLLKTAFGHNALLKYVCMKGLVVELASIAAL